LDIYLFNYFRLICSK